MRCVLWLSLLAGCNDYEINPACDDKNWFIDFDHDGFGDESLGEMSEKECNTYDNEEALTEAGFASESEIGFDCDDSHSGIYPNAPELCDEEDNDCDGMIDEADDDVEHPTWYADNDGDSYGDPSDSQQQCDQPSGYVDNNTDCDDADASVHEEASYYIDADGDGYGDAATTTQSCGIAAGLVLDDTDCDDSDAGTSPDADEICHDAIDNDCDGLADSGPGLSCAGAVVGLDQGLLYAANEADGWAGSALLATEGLTGSGYRELVVGAFLEDGGTVTILDAAGPGSSSPDDAIATITATADVRLGHALGSAELNEDSNLDLVVGGYYQSSHNGAVFVFSGPLVGDLDENDADLRIDGSDGMKLGYDLVMVDANDSGVRDLFASAPNAADGDGAVYLFTDLRSVEQPGSLSISDAAATFTGEGSGKVSVVAAGDVDGDGYADMLAAGHENDLSEGRAWLVLGELSGSWAADDADLSWHGDDDGDALGSALTIIDDLDGDERADVVLGAPGVGSDEGAVYVFFGDSLASSSGQQSLTRADLTLVGVESDALAGASVSSAGDVDGDSIADLWVGSPGVDSGSTDAGAAYLLLSSSGHTGTVELAKADLRLEGENTGDYLGATVIGTGDLDDDGLDDLAAGLVGGGSTTLTGGAAIVLFSSALSF